MSVKDKHGNNIRRNARVADLRPEKKQQGEVVGTYDRQVVVLWDSGDEETVRAVDVVSVSRSFR